MEKENILGTEKIGKLIKRFSIPCIISMLVNSLYNIVDQVFIGWGVGPDGNGATNIVFPLTMVALAFALMIGDGSSAYLSLKLGEKKKKDASRGVVNGIITAVFFAVVFAVLVLTFLPQILNLFGCTDILRPYAKDYGYIIGIGLPFMIIGTALNSVIRADGNPKYSMMSMVGGAVLNIILDPIFIFVFGMGVKGAAIATIISQIFTFILNASYIKKFNSISISKEDFKYDFKVASKVLALGISSFITQMSIVFVIGVENNLLVKYGLESEFGAETPITVLGIVMKTSQILNSIILGISVGSQPILGYNYGAKKYDRVKKTLKYVLTVSVVISTIAFILFQTIPDKLIGLFGSSSDPLYTKFACMAFRIYLMLVIVNGIQMPSGIFFQAIGKSTKSAVLSLSRQVLFLIPGMILLGKYFGLIGVLAAGPVADGLAFTCSTAFLVYEVMHMGKAKVKSQALVDDTSTDNKLEKQMVITIAREYGSGGRYVGRLVADKLGIKFYDKELIEKLAQETGLDEEFIEENEQRRDALADFSNGYYSGMNNSDELFVCESKLINELADKSSCVIIGRCSDQILKDRDNVVKVFVYSSLENKIKRAVEYYGLTEKQAKKEIKAVDKARSSHYKHYTGKTWNDFANYDICINSDTMGVEEAANLICKLVNEKQKTL